MVICNTRRCRCDQYISEFDYNDDADSIDAWVRSNGVLMCESSIKDAHFSVRQQAKECKLYEQIRVQKKHPRLSRPFQVGTAFR